VKAFARALSVVSCLALSGGCAHAGAGTEQDEEAAVAAGVRAAARLYLPPNEPVRGPFCVEVVSSADFEQGVVLALGAVGILAVPMRDCESKGSDAMLWIRVQSFEWMDIVTHGTLDVRGTVETRPDERSNFRLSWWRATFHASLGFRQGEWLTLSVDDLGRI
jgi:hypothetical protein